MKKEELWWVKLPGGICLIKVKIINITNRIITIDVDYDKYVASSLYITYKLEDLELVEKVYD